MKYKYFFIFAIIIAMLVFGTCRNNTSQSLGTENLDKDASYALGMSIGTEFKDSMTAGGIIPNMDEFLNGMRDVMMGRNTRFSAFEAMEKLDAAFASMMGERNAEAREMEIAFLAENARRPDVIITSSGLQYEVIVEGSGPRPSATSMIRVHYEGALADGTIFDSSFARQEPWVLYVNDVIPGWTEGLQLMSAGSRYRLFIPSELGYGENGFGPIPPYATLIFTIELLEIIQE